MLFSIRKPAWRKKAVFLSLLFALSTVLFSGSSFSSQAIYSPDASGLLTPVNLPPRTIVLTFDDGPSIYTDQILDVLKDKQVPATFFVIGNQALNQSSLSRHLSEGHEIGNHTFSHRDISVLPPWRLQLELGLARLTIISRTGRNTRLFRAPFTGSDELPIDQINSRHLGSIGRSGYIIAGEDVDSRDWSRPGVDQIVTVSTAAEESSVILLHDGGGDRSQTVAALPQIIDHYRSKGFNFVSTSQALGLTPDQVMPAPSPVDRLLATLAWLLFGAYYWLGRLARLTLIGLIVASFGRALLALGAALLHARRPPPTASARPACSIVVPAYNEEVVIEACLRSLLKSDYDQFEVIAVDDGSNDRTWSILQSLQHPRLRLFRKPNGGKASALNFGIAKAHSDIIVAIDADTAFLPDTLARLVRHFEDPRVGAVSGNTKVGNRHNLLTRLQSLEYVVGFNLDRRMGDLLDCITVVPGAIGAFRRQVLDRIGGFSYDTLAEDTDLTMSIQELGCRIVYDESAIAFTEAPATMRDLFKQRFRWSFGTMQCAWKHRHALLRPRFGSYGLVGLPYIVFYQILFPLIGPFFDLALIAALLAQRFRLMAISFAVYSTLELIMALVALRLDREKLRQVWLVLPQRLYYRQLMYYVLVRSSYNVLRGRLVGWGKLRRSGLTKRQA